MSFYSSSKEGFWKMFMLISPRKMTRGQRARMILRKAGGLLLKSHPGFFSLTLTKQHCVLVLANTKGVFYEASLSLNTKERKEYYSYLEWLLGKWCRNIKKAILCPNLSLGQKNFTFGSRSHWSLMVSKNL